MKQWSYVNTAAQLLNEYAGEEPFASFIKRYFSKYKKYGSRDRKQISHLCYCFFRLGKYPWEVSVEEKILIALYFCSDQSNDILEILKPDWNRQVALPLAEKHLLVAGESQLPIVFPWKDSISAEISFEAFNASFFTQPDLFLRLRPGKETRVKEKISKADIPFRDTGPASIALPAGVKLDDIIRLDDEAVVQDYNSQKVGELMGEGLTHLKKISTKPTRVWDCCAASGGKSMMAYDIDPSIQLTVSDVRASILINLAKRFSQAGINNYQSFVADLSKPFEKTKSKFDFVICDAPCTGSGTWGRTPEQLYHFEEAKIKAYASLQQKILANIIPHLRAEGYLLYITCSVFKRENESAVEYVAAQTGLQLIRSVVLKGYDMKADTMFAALFCRKALE